MSRSFSRFVPVLIALSTVPLLILTGCGAATSFSNPTASAKINGKIYGGQQPVANSTVTVWAAGITGYGSAALPLATTTTLADGTFSFPDNAYTCLTDTTQVYITAQGGNASPDYANPNITLATALGDCSAAHTAVVEINEVTTAATAFALAQFFTSTLGSSSTDSFGTNPADITAFTNSNKFTVPTLIDLPTGTVKPNTPAITIEAAKIYSIANTLAACVNDAADFSNCSTLFTNTTPPGGGTAPTDTLQAAVQMARFPYQNVSTLYQLAPKQPPFTGLSAAPYDWTIGVSYITPALGLGVTSVAGGATSASIDIDVKGNIWFPSNLPGNVGIAYFDPTNTTFNGPYLNGVFTNTGIDLYSFIQPQYVAIDSTGAAWITDEAYSAYGSIDTGSIANAPPGSSPQTTNILPSGGSSVTFGPVAADAIGDVYVSALVNYGSEQVPFLFEATSGAVGEFTHNPTGLVAFASPSGLFAVASTSSASTPCALEFVSSLADGGAGISTVLASTTAGTPCSSGGLSLVDAGNAAASALTSFNTSCADAIFAPAYSGSCGTPEPPSIQVDLPEGEATDGFGSQWIVMSGNGSVLLEPYNEPGGFSYQHGASYGNTMTTPYAIAIDGSGNVWLANAGCVTALTATSACSPGSFILSELIGAAAPTITPLSSQMVQGGALVGSVPGTILPPPPFPNSAQPHTLGPNSNGSNAAGKPLAFHRNL